MSPRVVECLRCGTTRESTAPKVGECPRCGYLGWAMASDLTERVRQALRNRPPELRRIRPI